MGIDLQKRVEETLEKGMSVVVEFPEVPGFEVEIVFVGRDELTKLYEQCTKKKYSHQSHKLEDEVDRTKLMKLWSERAIKSWKGLTLRKVTKLIPIELSDDDNPDMEIECVEANKLALLKHNADFDQFVLDIATNSDVFMEYKRQIKKEVENL